MEGQTVNEGRLMGKNKEGKDEEEEKNDRRNRKGGRKNKEKEWN